MTMWQFAAAAAGASKAKGGSGKGTGDIADDRLAEMGIEGF